ncbi:hypothetical protein Tco_1063017 [Tanacetum coccineum]
MLPSQKVIPFFKTLKHPLKEFKRLSLKKIKKWKKFFDPMSAELETQLQEKDNVIRNLKAQVSKMNDRSCETYNAKDVTALIEQNERVRAEIEKVKQHYKELYDSIKITRAHTNLNADMVSIDVKPIPPPFKNNRSAHLNYINHLKESVETFREIVEEARVVKPLDNALNYACQYIKLSQELLEYVIGTCPKEFNTKDNKAASTPLTRKKQVWKVKGKLSANGLNKAKHVWKATGKVFANVGYQWRPTRKKFTLGKHIGGHQWRPTGKMFLLGEQCPLTRLPVKCMEK